MNIRTITLALIATATVTAMPARAQDGGDSCPSGDWTTMRLSALKPGGTLDGFRQAMADHAKWYADHGYKADQFGFGQMMAMDRATGKTAPVAGKYVTFHWHTSKVTRDQHDAAWDAYVAKYAANSTVEQSVTVCMMK